MTKKTVASTTVCTSIVLLLVGPVLLPFQTWILLSRVTNSTAVDMVTVTYHRDDTSRRGLGPGYPTCLCTQSQHNRY